MKRIITIGRQFGAGGGEIGRAVAKELGLAFYDRDLILRTAQMAEGISADEIRATDERVPFSFGLTQSLFDFYNRPLGDRIWEAQVSAIRHIADQESCVIVGRNADFILREFDHCLRVFVHADLSWRKQRMAERMPEASPHKVESIIKAADKARRGYCEHFTGEHYGASENYDLAVCTSRLGVERATELVLLAARQM